MHIEKNVFDNIVNTCGDVANKMKDNLNSRKDLQVMNIRTDLHADFSGPKPVIPKAIYHMKLVGKKYFLMVLKNAVFPDGYAASLYAKIHLDTNKIVGLKTHDCHVIMIDLLPMALCRALPEIVCTPLIKISKYFKALYGKVIDVREMIKWEKEIPEILCELEKIFPPSFFDMMVHLLIHLVTEVKIGGPVHYRSMWSIERYIGKLKSFVHTTSHPEGSIAEGYIFDENLTFCSRYLSDCNTKFNRAPRHDDNYNPEQTPSSEPYLRIIGRPLSAHAAVSLDFNTWTQAHRCVLNSYPKIEEFADKHKQTLSARRRRSKREIESKHHRSFQDWFFDHVRTNSYMLSEVIFPCRYKK